MEHDAGLIMFGSGVSAASAEDCDSNIYAEHDMIRIRRIFRKVFGLKQENMFHEVVSNST